jgi:hypothetical protein
MLIGVPGHDFIEIHPANWQTQLDGCIAIGSGVVQDTPTVRMLIHSDETFQKFMDLMKDVDEIEVKINNFS